MRFRFRKRPITIALMSAVLLACAATRPLAGKQHRWWAGFGPVLPHDSFPAECNLCHVGGDWNKLKSDFKFDHLANTGFALSGAHEQAKCLRCHNDRGPVEIFNSQGCTGCHEDYHYGDLSRDCTRCHTEQTWRPVGQIALHDRTRFPLLGAHALVACYRCHPGARVGNFIPVDTECVTCHVDDRNNTTNPPHIPLGFVDNCHECHVPTAWVPAVN